MHTDESHAASRLRFSEEELPPDADAVPKKKPKPKVKPPPVPDKTGGAPAAPEATAGKNASALQFGDPSQKKPPKMQHAPKHRMANALSDTLHKQAEVQNEDENTAVTAADDGVRVSEATGRTLEKAYHAARQKSQRHAAASADHAPGQPHQVGTQSKLNHGTSAHSTGSAPSESGTAHAGKSNPISRRNQRKNIRAGYMNAHAGKAPSTAQKTTKGTTQAVKNTKEGASKAMQFVAKRKSSLLVLVLIAMLSVVMSLVSSCSPLVQTIVTANIIGTYPATEDDVRAAERAYANMERELQREIDQYEQRHPGYDEYRIDADEIWHDPYALIAIISARMDGEEWTMEDATPILEMYFDLQYELEVDVIHATRHHPDGTSYAYNICEVTLTNKNLSHQPVYSMSRRQMGLYALYMSTLGNMPGLFTGAHASTLRDPVLHDVLPAYLDADSQFALLITEAEKYIGYPYVWGGDSPETSFDCSGFLSYVFTATGVRNTGRLGARGLYGICDPVRPEDARPGDMVFFEGTMGDDVGGITHCGLYVGDGWMIHCGSPIGYANLNDSYWQRHFYGFGRAY